MIIMNVEKKLGDVLIKCDFKLDSNGITAVYGASGAGKTSIINMMAGLISPDSGIISFRDKEFFNKKKKINIPADKRFIGYVFQDSRLFPNMSVKDNLLYGSKRKSSYSLSCNLEQVCNLLGINHLLERYPQKLSGGEKQRVAIGRALLSNPEMLLMDEPLASLDSLRAKELISYINIIRNNYNIPIVLDADGLNILAHTKKLTSNLILTPHLKEFSRLTELEISKITENPIDIAKEYAKKYNIILLLKGPTTIVTDGNKVYLIDKGSAGMATAGSGDVLSGILIGLLGYKKPDIKTVAFAAYINGLAGEIAQKKKGSVSMLARDTIGCLSDAIKPYIEK